MKFTRDFGSYKKEFNLTFGRDLKHLFIDGDSLCLHYSAENKSIMLFYRGTKVVPAHEFDFDWDGGYNDHVQDVSDEFIYRLSDMLEYYESKILLHGLVGVFPKMFNKEK